MNKDKINFVLKGNAILLGVFVLYFFINLGSGFEIIEDIFDIKVWFLYIFAFVLFPILIAQSFFPIFFIIGAFNMLCVSLVMKIIDLLRESTFKKVLMYIAIIINILMLLAILFYFGLWTFVSLVCGTILSFVVCLIIFVLIVSYLILVIKKCFFK